MGKKNPDLASWCCRQILSDEIPVDISPASTAPELSHGNVQGDKTNILKGGSSILRSREGNLDNVNVSFLCGVVQRNNGKCWFQTQIQFWLFLNSSLHLKLLNFSLLPFPTREERLILSAFTSEGLWGQSLEKNLPSMQRIHKWLQGKKTQTYHWETPAPVDYFLEVECSVT